LCAVVKTGGIPAISALWRDTLEQVTADMDLDVSVLEIDNATYQLINAPTQFDVIVTPNMFGDVLGDCGALLLGARGMSFSGNFDHQGHAVYQTAHGAAHDIAGTGRANPVGQILSAAMMLRETFGLDAAAASIESAVDDVLASRVCTPDIALPGSRVVDTRELGACIAEAVAQLGGALTTARDALPIPSAGR
jgi:3-isopropylmalate dehydrogenase